jgi:predicted TIM-barrel enzyme
MARQDRQSIVDRLRQKIASGKPIIGGGAGTGLSAKCEERGGVDLIVIYNSGRYRMAGRGSLSGLLAYGNANQIVVEMASEVLPIVARTPVLAGVNGTDPFYDPDVFLPQLAALGFSGVQNFPTVGLIDGTFRSPRGGDDPARPWGGGGGGGRSRARCGVGGGGLGAAGDHSKRKSGVVGGGRREEGR